MQEDTIAAISTPLGEGGIGIVRISGPKAIKAAGRVIKSKSIELSGWVSHRMCHGYVYDEGAGDIIDEVLFCYMQAPRSYTTEDIVEINCHGGVVSLRKTLELVLASGVRLAEPGEFSKRAFLNGRLDLAQAEAVIDLIRTKTEKGLKLAVSQLKGKLSERITFLQNKLLRIIAEIEVTIDFPDESFELTDGSEIIYACNDLIKEIEELVDGALTGKIYREGIRVAITGRPNVGKSSLLNALLREERAIVTNVPGTTRDMIEEMISINGIPVCVIDTAGLRETVDLVEKIGVERTKEIIETADVVLAVFDGVTAFTEEDYEILELIKDKKCLLIVNKKDLMDRDNIKEQVEFLNSAGPVICLSALTGSGLEDLEKSIAGLALQGNVTSTDEIFVTNIRHKNSLEKSLSHLREAVSSLVSSMPIDIVAIDLREAWESLGEITGAAVNEDLIDRIFMDFCVGK